MYRRTDYWKLSTFLLIGILVGVFVGILTTKSNNKDINHKIILEVKKDSFIKRDTIKIAALPPLTEKNLKKELKKQGIKHPQIVLAQAKLESNLGKSSVSKRTNNLFGLRKGNRYRRFKHWTQSVSAYKHLIQSRYNGGSYYAFLNKINYADDPEYIDKLKELV